MAREEHAARNWVEGHFPAAQGTVKAMLILAYGAGLDAGLAEAQQVLEEAAEVLEEAAEEWRTMPRRRRRRSS